jgi:NADPH:quinone reductase-like Zn-dependent oxidoreductase
MQALVLTSADRPPRLAEVPEPDAAGLAPGSRVVPVLAAALNPVDVVWATPPLGRGPYPRVLGLEGVVDLDGRASYVERAVVPHGTFAPLAAVDPATAVPLPDGVAPADAAPLGIAGLAGWVPVETTGELRRGETVLVLGATGAVGQAAVQAARLLGAGRVVAAGRNEARLRRLQERGVADAIVVLGSDDDVAAMREATAGGADLVIDALYGPPLAAALASARPGARSVTVGSMAGHSLELPSASLFGRRLLSYANPSAPPGVKAAAITAMARHVVAGEFTIEHEVCPLADVERAWQSQVDRSGTKFVVVP